MSAKPPTSLGCKHGDLAQIDHLRAVNKPLKGPLAEASNVATRVLQIAIGTNRTTQEVSELGGTLKTFTRAYFSAINRFLRAVPLPLDDGAAAAGEELHLGLVPAAAGLGDGRPPKINHSHRFAWVLTNSVAPITWYDEDRRQGYAGLAGDDPGEVPQRPFAKRRGPGRRDHGLTSQLLSTNEDKDFALASFAFLDGITSADVEGYIGDPWPLTPQRPEVQAAVRKIREEPQSFAIARLNYTPVGYASLWKFRLEQEQEVFASLDVHGNIPEGMPVMGLAPGRYLGWISSVRIHPRFWSSKEPNRSLGLDPLIGALEQMLLRYADRQIYFDHVFVKAHHQAVIDIILQRFRYDPIHPREPGESDSVIKLKLIPWSLKADAFPELRKRYSGLQAGGDGAQRPALRDPTPLDAQAPTAPE